MPPCRLCWIAGNATLTTEPSSDITKKLSKAAISTLPVLDERGSVVEGGIDSMTGRTSGPAFMSMDIVLLRRYRKAAQNRPHKGIGLQRDDQKGREPADGLLLLRYGHSSAQGGELGVVAGDSAFTPPVLRDLRDEDGDL